jgi:inorganic pyrophosphatase
MIDQDQADDKIIAIMKGDEVYGIWKDITDVNEAVLMRLKHYFLTYKKGPNDAVNRVAIDAIYGREEAYEVIRRSQTDYQQKYLLP